MCAFEVTPANLYDVDVCGAGEMVLSTEWSQVEVIDLLDDGNGLGFILIGGRSTGVVIKGLLPGGVAERDGRLQSGDHVLQIGEVNLRGFNSEQVATVLRQTGIHVRLIVARSVDPSVTEYQPLINHPLIVQTKLLSDPEELSRKLYQDPPIARLIQISDPEFADFPLPPIPTELPLSKICTINFEKIERKNSQKTAILADPSSLVNVNDCRGTLKSPIDHKFKLRDECSSVHNFIKPDETETYQVFLKKNVYGLGITVAGYVCEEEELSGIFVKSIIEGSAAEMSGRILINDRIVAVNGQCLNGVTNYQAIEILRNTDIEVHLTLERFLSGRKFEHLQVALTEFKTNPQSQKSLPTSASTTTLSWGHMKSYTESFATDGSFVLNYETPSKDSGESNLSLALEWNENYRKFEAITSKSVSMIHSKRKFENKPQRNMNKFNSNHTDDTIKGISSEITNGVNRMKSMPNIATYLQTQFAEECSRPNFAKSSRNIKSLELLWGRKCPESKIIVSEINKISTLGISLEGTVDVEGGVEKRPHHFIRSILEDGPVGLQGILKPGDEILQVNEHKVQGLKHIEVIKVLKELPTKVRLICARGPLAPTIINTSQNIEGFESRSLLPGGHQSLQNLLTKAVSESSLYTTSTATLSEQQRSKSLENTSGLALWSSNVTTIEIEKTERGFGFSILDYQDPLNAESTIIVIRGLIPGGSAESTNEIFPGDRLVSVAEKSLQGLSLDEAVAILKAIPSGITKIGICRPLPNSDSSLVSPDEESHST